MVCMYLLTDYPTKRQSPIDLNARVTHSDASLVGAKLQFNYDPLSCKEISNGGYTWTVGCGDGKSSRFPGSQNVNYWSTALRASYLSDTYRLEQFHAHWGMSHQDGSEHTVDGKEFAGEVRARIHWRRPCVCADTLCPLQKRIWQHTVGRESWRWTGRRRCVFKGMFTLSFKHFLFKTLPIGIRKSTNPTMKISILSSMCSQKFTHRKLRSNCTTVSTLTNCYQVSCGKKRVEIENINKYN
jgi:hypothetical protein